MAVLLAADASQSRSTLPSAFATAVRFVTALRYAAVTVIDAAEFAVSEPIELVLVTATRICFATSSEIITYVEDVAPDIFVQVHEAGVHDCH